MNGRRAVTLVAWREIHERLRSKTFLASTVLILALVGGSAFLGRLVNPEKTYDVAVTAPAPAGIRAALQRAAQPFDDAKVHLRVVASTAAGQRLLEDNQVDVLLIPSQDRLIFRDQIDQKVAAAADTAVRGLRNELPRSPELTSSTLHPPKKTSDEATTTVAYVASILLFISLAFYGQWVISGIVEEKTNRVVEVILSTVQPRHLLAGKVIGIGSLGFAQLALTAGLAAGLLLAGVFDAPAAIGGDIALVIPWFVLGYALYAVAYAVAGAWPRVSRTPRRLDNPSPTHSSASTGPGLQRCPAILTGCWRRCSPSSH